MYNYLHIKITQNIKQGYHINEYLGAVNKHIIQPLYHTNLAAKKTAISACIRQLDEGEEAFKTFLVQILENFDNESKKKPILLPW